MSYARLTIAAKWDMPVRTPSSAAAATAFLAASKNRPAAPQSRRAGTKKGVPEARRAKENSRGASLGSASQIGEPRNGAKEALVSDSSAPLVVVSLTRRRMIGRVVGARGGASGRNCRDLATLPTSRLQARVDCRTFAAWEFCVQVAILGSILSDFCGTQIWSPSTRAGTVHGENVSRDGIGGLERRKHGPAWHSYLPLTNILRQ